MTLQIWLVGAVAVCTILALTGVLLWTLQHASDARAETLRTSAIDLAPASVLGCLAAILAVLALTRRIARSHVETNDLWVEAMERVAAGEFGHRLPHTTRNVEPITRAFNAMVDRLDAARRHQDGTVADGERRIADLTDRERAARKDQNLLLRACATAGVGGWEVDLAEGTLTWSDETFRLHDAEPDYRPTVETAIAFYTPDLPTL